MNKIQLYVWLVALVIVLGIQVRIFFLLHEMGKQRKQREPWEPWRKEK